MNDFVPIDVVSFTTMRIRVNENCVRGVGCDNVQCVVDNHTGFFYETSTNASER